MQISKMNSKNFLDLMVLLDVNLIELCLNKKEILKINKNLPTVF